MGQLKLLHFRLDHALPALTFYAHSLIGLIQDYPRLKHQWKLRMDIRSAKSRNDPAELQWFTLRTLMFAARSGSTIKKLSLNFITFSASLNDSQYAQLVQAFEGVRVQQISATPELFEIAHGTGSFIVNLLNTIDKGSLRKFKWRRQNWINDENNVGHIGHFLNCVQLSAISELISYDSHADCCREFRSDIGFYNSSERLLTIVTEFLSKMPNLREFTFHPCFKMGEPYTFQKDSFLLMIECFMKRAKQHKQGFKVHLVNVVDIDDSLHVCDFEKYFAPTQYSVICGIKSTELMTHHSLYLKVTHLSSARALVLNSYKHN